MTVLTRELMAQRRGRMWSITHETACSGAYFSVEFHHQTFYVVNVRYRPATSAAHRATVAAYNERFPEDCPLDAIAVLLGWVFVPTATVETNLDPDGDPDDFADGLRMLSAVRHNDLGEPHDPAALAFYLALLDHPRAGASKLRVCQHH